MIPERVRVVGRARRAGLVAALLLVASCGNGSMSDGSVSIVYQDIAKPGLIDQAVAIRRDGDVGFLPTIEYTALDSEGRTIPGVEVSTAFGSDRGLLIVPPSGGFDVLVFDGERVDDVVGATAAVTDVADAPEVSEDVSIEPEPLAGGEPVTKFDAFDAIALSNESPNDVVLRVVCLVYDSPSPGNAQQAEEITVVADRVLVGADEQVTVAVSDDFATRTAALGMGCHSLKAHRTP